MGGPGSGSHFHWWRSSAKTTVEACRTIDANRWTRKGFFKPHDVARPCRTEWTYGDGRKSSISFDVDMRSTERPSVRLYYSCRATATGEKEALDYRVFLTATGPRFGGLRWWFLCPLAGCGRRVSKLHLPPGGRYFGCRHCYDLATPAARKAASTTVWPASWLAISARTLPRPKNS